jgi:hypothetical protein
MSNQNSSIPNLGASFNARPAEQPTPTPATPREGSALPMTPEPRWVTKNTDLPDSTKRTFDIDVSKIAAGVEAALNVHDAAQARANGDDTFEQRRLRAEIARRVNAGEITNDHGRIWWETMFPGVDPTTLKGQS